MKYTKTEMLERILEMLEKDYRATKDKQEKQFCKKYIKLYRQRYYKHTGEHYVHYTKRLSG